MRVAGWPGGNPMGNPMCGLAGWLRDRWQARRRAEPRLVVLERVALAPRQSLLLVEAEGRRLLIATSPEGAPAIFPLDSSAAPDREEDLAGRVAW